VATVLVVGPTVMPVSAAGLVVDTLVDAVGDDGFCSLREAVTAANTDTSSGGTAGECPGGSGADAITFSVAGTILLAAGLPEIIGTLAVDGSRAITVDGAGSYRPFAIAAGWTLLGLVFAQRRPATA
jgi:CSLREA domain-containing protein